MKTLYLKLFVILLTMFVGVGKVWGETATLTFTGACGGRGTDDKGNTWTVSSDAAESNYDSTKGIHYGTGSAAVSYLRISTSGIKGTITKIVVYASGASNTYAKVSTKVGERAFGSQQSVTSSNAPYTFNGSASGEIEVSLTQSSAQKALYVKQIVVTYTVDNRTSVNKAYFSVNGVYTNPSGEEYEEGASIVFPSDPEDIDDKTFVGWYSSSYESDDTAPDFVSSATMGAEDVTFYAVFATQNGSNIWRQTDVSALTAGIYAIITPDGHAFNGTISSGHGQATSNAFVFTDGVATTAPTGTLEITIAENGSGFTMYNSSHGYLYAKAASSGNLAWQETEGSYWKKESALYWRYNSNGAYLRSYNNSSFRTYGTKSNNDIKFARKDVSYSDYCTSVSNKTLDYISVSGTYKTLYKVGDSFSTEGMVVTAYYEDGSSKTVSGTISKTEALTVDDHSITVSYTERSITKTADIAINVVALDHIAITTPPTKTTYYEGDRFDPAGMVVTGTWGTASPNIIEEGISVGECTITPDPLGALTTQVTVSYTHQSITKTATQTVTVTPLPKYTVIFDTGGHGTCVARLTEEVARQGITLPSVTADENYRFLGWTATNGKNTIDDGLEVGENFRPSDNVTLYAVYQHYHVISWSVAQEIADTTHVDDGNTLEMPASPSDREGKVFVGWYANANYRSDEAPASYVTSSVVPTEDATYYAVFATRSGSEPTAYNRVTSMSDLEGKDRIVVVSDYSAVVLSKSGDNVASATLDEAGISESSGQIGLLEAGYIWNLEGDATEGFRLSHSGSYLGAASLPASGSLPCALTPNNSSWQIGGHGLGSNTFYLRNVGNADVYLNFYNNSTWSVFYSTSGSTTSRYTQMRLYVPNTTATYSGFTTFYASGITYDVVYDKNTTDEVTGNLPSTFSYEEGETVVVSAAELERAGYVFVGWNTNSAALSGIPSFTMPGEDVTVYAIWREKPKYTVTFNIKGNATPVTETIGGGGVVPVATPQIGEYTFAGWSTSQVIEETSDCPDFVSLSEGRYYPKANETLYAVYTLDKVTSIPGFILSCEIADGVVLYVGSPNTFNASCNLAAVDTKASARSFWFEDSCLYFINNSNGKKVYVYSKGESDLYNHEEGNGKDEHSSNLWTKDVDPESGKTFFKRSDSRYLAYYSSNGYFRAYANTNPYLFTLEDSGESYDVELPHYTSLPSAAVVPTLTFASPTTTVVADQSVRNVATTNSSATVTYTSSDETVATVAADGTVTGHKFGAVTITAHVSEVPDAYYEKSAAYTMNVTRITTTIHFDGYEREGEASVYAGNAYSFPAVTNAPQDDADPPIIVYSLANNTYATINAATGEIVFKPAEGVWSGSKTVTAYAKVPGQTSRYSSANTSSTYAKMTFSVRDNRKPHPAVAFETTSYDIAYGADAEVFTNGWATNQAPKTGLAVTYASDNTAVAEVDAESGEVSVHPMVPGSATITATIAGGDVTEEGTVWAYGGTTATFVVTVQKQPSGLAFTQSELDYRIGEDNIFDLSDYVTKTTDAEVTYALPLGTQGAELADELFEATMAGDYVITASVAATAHYAADEATITIHATDSRAVPTFQFTQQSYTYHVLTDLNLNEKLENNSDGAVTWRLASEVDYADIDENTGYFYGIEGDHTLTVVATLAATPTYQAASASCKVNLVDRRGVPVLTFESDEQTAQIRKEYTFTASCDEYPEETITYTCTDNDGDVVLFDGDVVLFDDDTAEFVGYRTGTYTITAHLAENSKHKDGEATCVVTVEDNRARPDLRFELSVYTLYINNAYTTLRAVSAAGSDGVVTYRNAQPSRPQISVDAETGEIVGYAPGTYYVKADIAETDDFLAQTDVQCTVVINSANTTHSASFYVNGNLYIEQQQYAEGDAIGFPQTDPKIGEGTFFGWAESWIAVPTNVAPVCVTSKNMGTANLDFYAVYLANGRYFTEIPFALSLESGSYIGEQTVRILNQRNGYSYLYTVDGADPSFGDPVVGELYDEDEGIRITASCTLKVVALDESGNIRSDIVSADYIIIPMLFYESFDLNSVTGGNDGNFTAGTGTLKADNPGWTFVNGKGARACAKFGTSSAAGSATTPAINFTGVARVSFRAAAYDNNNEKTTLNITASSGSMNHSEVTLERAAWNDYELYLEGVESTTQITFAAASARNNRFYLDEVAVERAQQLNSSANLKGWKGFYNASENFEVDENTAIYTARIKEEGDTRYVCFKRRDTRIIPRGHAVYLKTVDAESGYKLYLTATQSDPDLNWENLNPENEIKVSAGTFDDEGYVIAYKNSTGLMLYHYSQIPSGVIYIPYEWSDGDSSGGGGASAPAMRIVIDDDDSDTDPSASAIEPLHVEGSDEVYDLSGMKSSTRKGIVVKNSKVIMVK